MRGSGRRSHTAEIAVAEVANWHAEVRMVECVEEFCAELCFDLLADRRNFPCRKVLADHARPDNSGPPRGAESNVSRNQSFWRDKAFRLEELLDCLLAPRQRRIAGDIGPEGAIRTHAPRITAAPYCERITGCRVTMPSTAQPPTSMFAAFGKFSPKALPRPTGSS